MDFSAPYLQVLSIVLAVLMGAAAFANWLNRRRGGFMRGWEGAIFIAVCWIAALVLILLRVRGA